IARFVPGIASKVLSINSARDCVSTWIVTSSGSRFSSTSSRTKAKSVSEAAGNPTSISLKPSFTSISNMRRFFSGPIGSTSAWLPSRRSTEHQVGALSMVRGGHLRSGRLTGENARYLWIVISDIKELPGSDRQLGRSNAGGGCDGRRERAGGLIPPAGAKSAQAKGNAHRRAFKRNHRSHAIH